MAVCVSMINMKGGVGKTTLATQIAWDAAIRLDKKVLLVDLDPRQMPVSRSCRHRPTSPTSTAAVLQ
jgi:cellulose biosynthesis protein BcsQ